METIMHEARDALRRLLAVNGVAAALVASTDGLLIDGAGSGEHDLEAVAAVGTYAVQATSRLSELGDRGRTRRVTIEGDDHLVLLECLSDQAILVVVLDDRMNLGYARFLLDRYHQELLTFAP